MNRELLYPQPAVLQQLGKVAVAAATLEFDVANVFHPDGHTAAAGPVLDGARKAAAACAQPLRDEVMTLLEEVGELLKERNVAIHAYAFSAGLTREGSEYAPVVRRRNLRHKTNAIDDPAYLAGLVRRMEHAQAEIARLSFEME